MSGPHRYERDVLPTLHARVCRAGGALRHGVTSPPAAVPITLSGHYERGWVTAVLMCREQP